ncbi:VCBS domain-containing protein, partial [Chitinimonas sp. PSY-7]|uniref:VCBS domain-containing protein n=1 Tax=Chitinimonas sp. PSY-7 TaxID=3459088 RepID=UPI0040402FC0
VANSAVQYLKAGETKLETFTVLSTDGTPHEIKVTITGTNDKPVISGDTSGKVIEAGGESNTEAGVATASGTLRIRDTDHDESRFQAPNNPNGVYGTFKFDPDTGKWTYALDNSRAATQALTEGQEVHDTLTVTSLDGGVSQVIDVTVTGKNDNARISGTATGSVVEDGQMVASGTLQVSDVDSGDALFLAPSGLNGTYGKFTFNEVTGVWGYIADPSKIQFLSGNQQVQDVLTVKSKDGTATQDITVTIQGANDAPSGKDAHFTIQEDGSKVFTAADFGFSDVDAGDSLKAVRIDALPTAGMLTLNGAVVTSGQAIAVTQLGELVFTPAANANGNNYASFTFSVQDQANAFDPLPNKISIDVTPVNDVPAATDYKHTTDEDKPFSGRVAATDVDGDRLTYNTGRSPAHGTVIVKPDGNWTYTPAKDYNGKDSFTVTVSDGKGGVAISTINLDVTPVNDAPSGKDARFTIQEDGRKIFAAADFGF